MKGAEGGEVEGADGSNLLLEEIRREYKGILLQLQEQELSCRFADTYR